MTLLAPLMGLLAAALTVPVLIAFYLLKLRRRPVRVSSTLLWERAIHDLQVNAPFRWIRPSLLLFIQLLALLLLALAAARPAVEGDLRLADRVVIVIDRSASMSALDGLTGGSDSTASLTRLDEAKRRAREFLSSASRGSSGGKRPRIMIVQAAAEATVLTTFLQSPGALRDAIDAITPTDQPGELDDILRLVAALGAGQSGEEPGAGQDGGQEGNGERTAVYVFSDGGLTESPDISSRPTLPQRTSLELVRIGPATQRDDAGRPLPLAPANLGITALSAKRDYDDPAIVRFFVRVQNSGPTAQEVVVELIAGESQPDSQVESQSEALTVPAAVTDTDGNAEPGEAAVTFQLSTTEGLLVRARVRAGGDDLLDADNTAAIYLGRPRDPRILVVAPADAQTGAPAPDLFLLSVLREMDLGSVRLMTPAAAAPLLRGEAASSQAESYDLVVLDRVRPDVLPPIPSLSFGAALPIPGLGVVPGDSASSTRFLAWRRTHPVLRYVSLDGLIVSPPMTITLPGAAGATLEAAPAPAASSGYSFLPLALGEQGPLIVLAEPSGGGGDGAAMRRIIVGFELMRSNWGPEISFPVFMTNAVEYLTVRAQAATGIAFTTAELARVQAIGPGEVVARNPGGEAFARRTLTAPGESNVSLGVVERVGVYQVAGAAPGHDLLPINLVNPGESSLLLRDRLPGAVSATPTASAPASAGPQHAHIELWPWCVAAALALACLEWVLYAWRMRA
ncbi:MAG: BatA domain-containing protein [Phycisphaerales bacterium]|nr:BatA domain-containing protein [Phycisphaerales bacterium]